MWATARLRRGRWRRMSPNSWASSRGFLPARSPPKRRASSLSARLLRRPRKPLPLFGRPISSESQKLATEGVDLITDVLKEGLQARTDATGMGEAGELVEVVAQARDLANHRERRSGSDGREATIAQEMAQ